MLLTLGNEEQTWTMDTGGTYGGWERGKLKKKGTGEEKDRGSCSTVEVIKTHKVKGG